MSTKNPRIFTQKGHLAPADVARELKREREAKPKAPAPKIRVTQKDNLESRKGLTE